MTVSNDNASDPSAPLTLEEELGHGVIHLAMHEKQIGRMIFVKLPNGATKPLGEILLRIGQYIQDKEREKPRLVLPPRLIR